MKNKGLYEEVRALVQELKTLQQKRYDAKGWDYDMELGPPASEAEIRKFETRIDFTLPPSYRAFLRVHNGWYLFWPDWCLAGVSGKISDHIRNKAEESRKDAVDMLKDDAYVEDEDPEAYIAQLKEEEKDNPDVIYPGHHPILGTDFNGSVLLFDRHRCGPDGECEVVAVDHIGEVFSRWTTFVHLVQDAIADTRADLLDTDPEAEL